MSLIPLGAFWKKQDKNGKTYLSGNFSEKLTEEQRMELAHAFEHNEKVFMKIWQNERKHTDKGPDYILYWSTNAQPPAAQGESNAFEGMF